MKKLNLSPARNRFIYKLPMVLAIMLFCFCDRSYGMEISNNHGQSLLNNNQKEVAVNIQTMNDELPLSLADRKLLEIYRKNEYKECRKELIAKYPNKIKYDVPELDKEKGEVNDYVIITRKDTSNTDGNQKEQKGIEQLLKHLFTTINYAENDEEIRAQFWNHKNIFIREMIEDMLTTFRNEKNMSLNCKAFDKLAEKDKWTWANFNKLLKCIPDIFIVNIMEHNDMSNDEDYMLLTTPEEGVPNKAAKNLPMIHVFHQHNEWSPMKKIDDLCREFEHRDYGSRDLKDHRDLKDRINRYDVDKDFREKKETNQDKIAEIRFQGRQIANGQASREIQDLLVDMKRRLKGSPPVAKWCLRSIFSRKTKEEDTDNVAGSQIVIDGNDWTEEEIFVAAKTYDVLIENTHDTVAKDNDWRKIDDRMLDIIYETCRIPKKENGSVVYKKIEDFNNFLNFYYRWEHNVKKNHEEISGELHQQKMEVGWISALTLIFSLIPYCCVWKHNLQSQGEFGELDLYDINIGFGPLVAFSFWFLNLFFYFNSTNPYFQHDNTETTIKKFLNKPIVSEVHNETDLTKWRKCMNCCFNTESCCAIPRIKTGCKELYHFVHSYVSGENLQWGSIFFLFLGSYFYGSAITDATALAFGVSNTVPPNGPWYQAIHKLFQAAKVGVLLLGPTHHLGGYNFVDIFGPSARLDFQTIAYFVFIKIPVFISLIPLIASCKLFKAFVMAVGYSIGSSRVEWVKTMSKKFITWTNWKSNNKLGRLEIIWANKKPLVGKFVNLLVWMFAKSAFKYMMPECFIVEDIGDLLGVQGLVLLAAPTNVIKNSNYSEIRDNDNFRRWWIGAYNLAIFAFGWIEMFKMHEFGNGMKFTGEVVASFLTVWMYLIIFENLVMLYQKGTAYWKNNSQPMFPPNVLFRKINNLKKKNK